VAITPQLQARGIFTLKAPWDKDLLTNTQYTCVAIRNLSEIVANGGDPFTDYYAAHSLDQSIYNTDVQNGVSIVSLQASDNSLVEVPTSYIAAFPDGGGVPYRVVLLSVPLGSVPDSLDLSAISSKVQSDVRDIIGVTCTVRPVVVSNVMLLNTADADAAETARQANITNSTTDFALYQQSQADLVAAQQKISELESYILTLQGATPPVPPNTSLPGPTTPPTT
jgi:hypothetical protein